MISPTDQINKPITARCSKFSVRAPTCISFIDSILGFIGPSLLSVIRIMSATHLILCLLTILLYINAQALQYRSSEHVFLV